MSTAGSILMERTKTTKVIQLSMTYKHTYKTTKESYCFSNIHHYIL